MIPPVLRLILRNLSLALAIVAGAKVAAMFGSLWAVLWIYFFLSFRDLIPPLTEQERKGKRPRQR